MSHNDEIIEMRAAQARRMKGRDERIDGVAGSIKHGHRVTRVAYRDNNEYKTCPQCGADMDERGRCLAQCDRSEII